MCDAAARPKPRDILDDHGAGSHHLIVTPADKGVGILSGSELSVKKVPEASGRVWSFGLKVVNERTRDSFLEEGNYSVD